MKLIYLLSPLLLLFAGCGSSKMPSSAEDTHSERRQDLALQENEKDQISAYYSSACAILHGTVKCWTDRSSKEILDIPEFDHPMQISVGLRHACALDSAGVKCWGSNQNGETVVPTLSHPTFLSTGVNATCVIDSEVVRCWKHSESEYGLTKVPALIHPRQISVGLGHACAIDDDGVKCWGNTPTGKFEIPKFKNPIQVSAGDEFTCVLDEEKVSCWGHLFGKTAELTEVPPLNHPTQVSTAATTGFQSACATDADGIKCWSNKGGVIQASRRPKQISMGANTRFCELYSEGVYCEANEANAAGWRWTPQVLPADMAYNGSPLAPTKSWETVSVPPSVPPSDEIPGDRWALWLALPAASSDIRSGTLNLICQIKGGIDCAAGILETNQMTALSGDSKLKDVLLPWLNLTDNGDHRGRVKVQCTKASANSAQCRVTQ